MLTVIMFKQMNSVACIVGALQYPFSFVRRWWIFIPSISSPELAILSLPVVPEPTIPPDAVYVIEVFDRDRGPHMRYVGYSDFFAAIPVSFNGTCARSWEVELLFLFIILVAPPPSIPPAPIFEERVKLRTLNKCFMEGKVVHFFPTKQNKKKKCVSFLPRPALPFGAMDLPLTSAFSPVIFIEDNENLKHGERG